MEHSCVEYQQVMQLNRDHHQSRTLRIVLNVPRYTRNEYLFNDLKTPTVKEETNRYANKLQQKVATHPNQAARGPYETFTKRRLKRKQSIDLTIGTAMIRYYEDCTMVSNWG